jgi:hypothetical protein
MFPPFSAYSLWAARYGFWFVISASYFSMQKINTITSGIIENEFNRMRNVSQWKLIRDREQVSEGESILNSIL